MTEHWPRSATHRARITESDFQTHEDTLIQESIEEQFEAELQEAADYRAEDTDGLDMAQPLIDQALDWIQRAQAARFERG